MTPCRSGKKSYSFSAATIEKPRKKLNLNFPPAYFDQRGTNRSRSSKMPTDLRTSRALTQYRTANLNLFSEVDPVAHHS